MLYVFIKDRIMHGAKILDRCGFFPAIRTEVGREKLFGSWLWIYEDAIM
jgi:hypothetical protein